MKLKKKLMTSPLFVRFAFRLIRLYSRTFRLRVENESPWMDHIRAGGRVLICTWHQQFFSLIRYYRNYRHYRPSLMISQSRDGDLIAGIANLTHWHTVRGSSSRDGMEALQQMISRLRETGLAAHILDGPRGPIGIVKKGAVYLARGAEAMMVPVFVSAEKSWLFNSWDRFLLPKPFSKVTIRYGDMIPVSVADGTESVEADREKLEKIMRQGLYR